MLGNSYVYSMCQPKLLIRIRNGMKTFDPWTFVAQVNKNTQNLLGNSQPQHTNHTDTGSASADAINAANPALQGLQQ